MSFWIFFFVVICIGIMFIVYMWSEAHRNKIQAIDIKLEQFPESFNGLRVFFISDIHTREIAQQLLNQIEDPVDLVIIGGDLMEKGVPFSRVSRNLDKLTRLAPTYFVWGNNDYEIDFRRLDVLLREKGIHVLDNTSVSFESEGSILHLVGVDDLTLERDRLDLALQDVEGKGFRLLASHNPLISKKINREHQIGFVFSGHTHGGQIRLFKFGIAERGGIKDSDATKVFISNGYGYTKLPFRFCAPAEAHIITFRSDRG